MPVTKILTLGGQSSDNRQPDGRQAEHLRREWQEEDDDDSTMIPNTPSRPKPRTTAQHRGKPRTTPHHTGAEATNQCGEGWGKGRTEIMYAGQVPDNRRYCLGLKCVDMTARDGPRCLLTM